MVLLPRPGGDQLVQVVVVAVAAQHVGEAVVLRPLRMADGPAERPPLGVVAHRQDEPVVVSPAWVAALRGEPGAAVADALRLAVVEQVVHEGVAAHRGRRLLL